MFAWNARGAVRIGHIRDQVNESHRERLAYKSTPEACDTTVDATFVHTLLARAFHTLVSYDCTFHP